MGDKETLTGDSPFQALLIRFSEYQINRSVEESAIDPSLDSEIYRRLKVLNETLRSAAWAAQMLIRFLPATELHSEVEYDGGLLRSQHVASDAVLATADVGLLGQDFYEWFDWFKYPLTTVCEQWQSSHEIRRLIGVANAERLPAHGLDKLPGLTFHDKAAHLATMLLESVKVISLIVRGLGWASFGEERSTPEFLAPAIDRCHRTLREYQLTLQTTRVLYDNLEVELFRAINCLIQQKQKVETPPQADRSERPRFAHSPDFFSVRWEDEEFSFTGNQARCVEVLWEAWKAGTPTLANATILERADISGERLKEVFRLNKKGEVKQHPAWGRMIILGNAKGTCRIAGEFRSDS